MTRLAHASHYPSGDIQEKTPKIRYTKLYAYYLSALLLNHFLELFSVVCNNNFKWEHCIKLSKLCFKNNAFGTWCYNKHEVSE